MPGADTGPFGALGQAKDLRLGQLALSSEARVNGFEAKAGFATVEDYYALDAGVDPNGGMGGGFDPSHFSDFTDILGDLFGFGDFFGAGRRRSNRPARGNDLRYDLQLTFEEAVFGKEISLDIPRVAACATCNGSGAKPGTPPAPQSDAPQQKHP